MVKDIPQYALLPGSETLKTYDITPKSVMTTTVLAENFLCKSYLHLAIIDVFVSLRQGNRLIGSAFRQPMRQH